MRYIPLNSVDWQGSNNSLLCQEFDRDCFMKRFSMTGKPEMLPLLAVLMGNDYVNPHTFDRVSFKKQQSSKSHFESTNLITDI